MHLTLQLNQTNAVQLVNLLDIFANYPITIIFNRQQNLVNILVRNNVLFQLKQDTLFNLCDLQCSTPFSITFEPKQLINHYRLLKKAALQISLRHIPQKSPELVFQLFNSETQYINELLISSFVQSIVLKKGNNFQQIEDDLAKITSQIAQFNETSEQNITFIIPKQINYAVLIPLNDDENLQIMCTIKNQVRYLTFEQQGMQCDLECNVQQPDVEQSIVVKTQDFVDQNNSNFQLNKAMVNSYISTLSYNQNLMIIQMRSQDEFYCSLVPAISQNEQ